MGKSKIRRIKNRSVNPVGIPSIKELEENGELACTNLETGNLYSFIEKLQSSEADERECAAFTIANMASNPNFVTSVIENKIIRIAAPLLLDRNPAVRHAIAGCLRNLAAYGDHSVCQAMVDQDILTSLVALLLEYKKPWTPVKILENKIDTKSEVFLESCNLLWSLCESSDTAVTIFNKKELIKVLLPCLNIDVYGLQIPLAVAQCLHTVGEENTDVIEELSQSLVQEQLKALMTLTPVEPEHVLLKTLAAGIMLNIVSGKIHRCRNDVTNPLIKVTASSLSEPINPALVLLSEQLTSHKRERLNKYHDEKDLEEKFNAVSKTLKTVDHMLQAKQISLEIIANICVGDDSSDEWDDFSGSDTNEEMDIDVDGTAATRMKLGLEIHGEILNIVMHWKLLDKVINQIVIPSDDVLKTISGNSQGKDILKRLSTVRCRALLCLSNMVENLSIDDIGGPSKLFDLWMNIAHLLFKQTDSSNTEQMEAATHAMRAVLQKLAEGKYSSQFSNLSESDLELFTNIYHHSQDSSVKVNAIRALGTIGCLLGNPDIFHSSHKLINIIGTFLLETCSKCSDLWVAAEALDAIFDVFSEDHIDIIAQEIHLVEKLINLMPFLKGKIKQQRKSLGEHLPVIMTAKTNLIRFIKYKKEHVNV